MKTLRDEETSRWDEFVLSHDLGTIYHTSMWRELVRIAYKHLPTYFILEDHHGQIRAGLPLFSIESRLSGNRLSTIPCAQSCDPLVSNPSDHEILMESVIDMGKKRKSKYYELKTSRKYPHDCGKYGHKTDGYFTHILDIDRPLETIMKSFHKSMVQRAIRNSQKCGLELAFAGSTGDVQPFFLLYLDMRKRYGLLPQPERFFSSMWKIMSGKGHIDILFAKYKGRVVSTVLLLKYKDTVTYEYGASDPAMLSLHPSHFLLWAAIKRSVEQGYKRFDFGRTSGENPGLSEFKARWGATTEELPYYHIPDASGFASARNAAISRKLMDYTVRALPNSFCGHLGGWLYKSFV